VLSVLLLVPGCQVLAVDCDVGCRSLFPLLVPGSGISRQKAMNSIKLSAMLVSMNCLFYSVRLNWSHSANYSNPSDDILSSGIYS
jgi:hypothetical protein